MVGIVDLEAIETERKLESQLVKDTWILRLPKDICDQEGFAEGTLVSLTVKNGGIQSSFIRPKTELLETSKRLKAKNKELYEELKKLGD